MLSAIKMYINSLANKIIDITDEKKIISHESLIMFSPQNKIKINNNDYVSYENFNNFLNL